MEPRHCFDSSRRHSAIHISSGAGVSKGVFNMPLPEPFRVGYVVKRYPRYSETFVVREILAHERAGLEIQIYAMRPSNDSHFQDLLCRVRAPVRCLYFSADGLRLEGLTSGSLTATNFWKALAETAGILPGTC